jgi:phytol kinase
MSCWVAGMAVLAALSGLLAGAGALRRSAALPAEAARKAVHVGMGLVCVTFPWLFADPRPVIVLASIAIAALVAARCVPVLRAHFGCALHDVGRRSYGELAFVAGIVSAFILASGNAIVYVVPVLALTLADPAAALIGLRCRRHRFTTRDGTKSIAGSLAFFATTAVCTTVALALTGRTHAVAAGLVAGAMLMLIEASAWAGLDNFAIPFAGGVLMRSLEGSCLVLGVAHPLMGVF